MQTQIEALKQWANDNNIPQEYLYLLNGNGGRDKRYVPDHKI